MTLSLKLNQVNQDTGRRSFTMTPKSDERVYAKYI
jgi:hypothetical protein